MILMLILMFVFSPKCHGRDRNTFQVNDKVLVLNDDVEVSVPCITHIFIVSFFLSYSFTRVF
jgi:hypothetical protein